MSGVIKINLNEVGLSVEEFDLLFNQFNNNESLMNGFRFIWEYIVVDDVVHLKGKICKL